MTPGPSAAEREFPRWHFWRGIAGLRYASRRLTSPPVVRRGENTLDLTEKIRAAEEEITDGDSFRWPPEGG